MFARSAFRAAQPLRVRFFFLVMRICAPPSWSLFRIINQNYMISNCSSRSLTNLFHSLFVDMPPRLEVLEVPMLSSTPLELLPLEVLVTGTLARAELPLLRLQLRM
jgi:hypothetical protein